MGVYLGISFAVVGAFGLVSGHLLRGGVFLASGAVLVLFYLNRRNPLS